MPGADIMIPRISLTEFLLLPGPIVRLSIAEVKGSSPREIGAEMFVHGQGLYGTIGGGHLEYMAIDAARRMLSGEETAAQLEVALGPGIGQCCGGRITVDLNRMSAMDRDLALVRAETEKTGWPELYILGAGHVGRALAELMQYMPVRTILIDSRPDQLSMNRAAVETRNSVLPEADISMARAGSAFVVLTHDHGLDFLLAAAALKRADAAYVGMIGSATKRARFDNWVQTQDQGQNPADLICPIGAGHSRDKRPAVIAAFIAAEVMAHLTGEAARRRSGRAALPLHAAE